MKRLLLLLLCACAEQAPEKTPAAGDTQPAAAALSEGEKERIRQFWSIYRRATQLRVQGDWEAAVPLLHQAVELNPQHEDGLYYLGNGLFETGHYWKAAARWEQLLQVNPHSTRAHLRLSALFSSALSDAPFDLERAESEVRAALAINKEESGTVLKLGEVLLLKGDLEGAKVQLAAAARTNARSATARYLLGYILWREGKPREAADLLGKASELRSGPSRSHSASNEGDTRDGRGPMLAAGAIRGNLFAMRLAALDASPSSIEKAQREYAALATELAKIAR